MGVKKKMNVWGTEIFTNPTSNHCLGGCLSKKILCKRKYGFKGSISNVDLGHCSVLAEK